MTWVIVNPKAASGRALSAGQSLCRMLPECRLALTERPGHATELAREAVRDGARSVVAVGGDGTIQQIAAGLCTNEDGGARRSPIPLALLPVGTGGDYRRNFGFDDSIQGTVRRLSEGTIRHVGVGRASVQQHGKTRSVIFINVLSFGLGGLTDQLVEQGPKWLGGRTAFFLGAVRANMAYDPHPVRMRLDGEELPIAKYSNVAICIGSFFGGGMHIAPLAQVDGGWFEVVTIEGTKLQTMALAASIYQGTHLRRSGVRRYRARRVEASLTRSGQCLVDADGELPGVLPVSADLEQDALSLLV